jgi:hypothetical protein
MEILLFYIYLIISLYYLIIGLSLLILCLCFCLILILSLLFFKIRNKMWDLLALKVLFIFLYFLIIFW